MVFWSGTIDNLVKVRQSAERIRIRSFIACLSMYGKVYRSMPQHHHQQQQQLRGDTMEEMMMSMTTRNQLVRQLGMDVCELTDRVRMLNGQMMELQRLVQQHLLKR